MPTPPLLPWIRVLALASAGIATALISLDSTEAADKPNVLLIVADDLGFSDLGCYGGEIATPVLDRLAEGGTRFTRFYTTGRCCPSRASILTGLYPHRAALGHMTQDLGEAHPGYRGRVSPDAVTIPEALKSSGYRSFIAGKWHLGTDDPTQHGFEEFYGTLVSAKTFWDPDHMLRLPEGRPRRSYAEGEFYATHAVTDHALDFLAQARETPDKPWFLYLAYHAPHFPLQAPAPEIARHADRYHGGWDELRKERLARMKALGVVAADTSLSSRSRYWDYGEVNTGTNPAWDSLPENRRADLARRMAIYAAMVALMDRDIGRVVEDLEKAGEFENTLIVFVSDNGACAEWDPHGFDIKSSPNNILFEGEDLERMGEPGTFHSVGSGWANASNTPWRLYKHFNHEGGISSPAIAHWPEGSPSRGEIERRPVHLIDLMPTVLDAAGASYPTQFAEREVPALPGRSFLPLLRGETGVEDRALYFEHEGNRAVIDGEWKLVALKNGPWELYRILADRTESEDLADRYGDKVKELEANWSAWAAENDVTPLPKDLKVNYLKPTLE